MGITVSSAARRWYLALVFMASQATDCPFPASGQLRSPSYALAHREEAKSLELRAAMSLSWLWHQQGKRKEAHDLLAEVYAWFTEGFDTAESPGGQGVAGGASVKMEARTGSC